MPALSQLYGGDPRTPVCVAQINNRGRESFVAGHIHKAPVGVAGPIVVPLLVVPSPATSARHIKQSGTATPNPGTTGRRSLPEPERALRQLPHDGFPGRRDPRALQ